MLQALSQKICQYDIFLPMIWILWYNISKIFTDGFEDAKSNDYLQ